MTSNLVDYNDVIGVSPEEFRERSACLREDVNDPSKFTRADDEEVAKIERLLDITEGTLLSREDDFYLEYMRCECGRVLTSYDFVMTALVDAGHSKSIVLHTFVGNKFVLNEPRPVRCSQCARIVSLAGQY